jgi:tetratricopeptide (TPR) repeat protein
MGTIELDRLLQQGITAARAGQKEQARDLLLQVIALDDQVEAAWLWLSGVVDDPEERQICLENVLSLNPDNAAARNGLSLLSEQASSASPPARQPDKPRPVLSPVPAEIPSLPEREPLPPQPAPVPVVIEIDPYGCPFCGGSVGDEEPVCNDCQRSVALRYRKREENTGVIWLVLFFLLLGFVSVLEGFFVSQLAQVGQLPGWMSQSALNLLVGSALFGPNGMGELAEFASVVVVINYVLAGLCVLDAVGLALRSRAFYFGSFLLAGVMVIVTVAGLLAQLTGWLPTIFRLGLIAVTVKWLMDSAPAFEWTSRTYNADIDQGLKTDMDYHNRAQIYYDRGMWAKAAAHWKVASRLAPGQVQHRAELANAYLRMGVPAAALVEADKAVAQAPDDKELRAFRNALARLEVDR